MYVSIDRPDFLDINIVNEKLFTSKTDNQTLAEDFRIVDIKVPRLIRSKGDLDSLKRLAASAQNSMILSLVVPIAFSMFMSISMDNVWGLYNMLQIECNIINLTFMTMPANAQYLISILKPLTAFKIGENKIVKKWLKTYVFARAEFLQEIIFGQGVLVQGVFIIGILLFIIGLGLVVSRKIYTLRQFFLKKKEALMWSSVFRS